MTALDQPDATAIAHAVLDGEGRLMTADPALAALNTAAGGAIGQPLALPALAAIVGTVRRLGIAVSRRVEIADDGDDLVLWISARPSGEGVRLAAGGWEAISSAPRATAAAELPAPSEALRWECDATLRLIRLTNGSVRDLAVAIPDMIGKPIGALLAEFDPAHPGNGLTVLLPAQTPVSVAVEPLHTGEGGVGGYRGTAVSAGDRDPARLTTPPLPPAFTAGLDRALRRPLAQIVANADSIAQATDGPIAPDYADYAADIAGAGRHLLALVDDLVDLEAVERPGFTLRAEAIDLADVARRAAGLLTVRAEAAGVSISRPVPETQLPATGDFRRALQIVVNLVTNAVRYAPPGSAVVVAVGERDGQAQLSVDDRGKGIALADHSRVFEKFERVDPSEAGGNGLGLYIARRLARAMRGDLTVESAPGEGARFTLSLPKR